LKGPPRPSRNQNPTQYGGQHQQQHTGSTSITPPSRKSTVVNSPTVPPSAAVHEPPPMEDHRDVPNRKRQTFLGPPLEFSRDWPYWPQGDLQPSAKSANPLDAPRLRPHEHVEVPEECDAMWIPVDAAAIERDCPEPGRIVDLGNGDKLGNGLQPGAGRRRSPRVIKTRSVTVESKIEWSPPSPPSHQQSLHQDGFDSMQRNASNGSSGLGLLALPPHPIIPPPPRPSRSASRGQAAEHMWFLPPASEVCL